MDRLRSKTRIVVLSINGDLVDGLVPAAARHAVPPAGVPAGSLAAALAALLNIKPPSQPCTLPHRRLGLSPKTPAAHLHAAAVLGREVRAGDVVVRAVARAAEVPLPRGAPVVDDPAADQSEVSTGSRDRSSPPIPAHLWWSPMSATTSPSWLM